MQKPDHPAGFAVQKDRGFQPGNRRCRFAVEHRAAVDVVDPGRVTGETQVRVLHGSDQTDARGMHGLDQVPQRAAGKTLAAVEFYRVGGKIAANRAPSSTVSVANMSVIVFTTAAGSGFGQVSARAMPGRVGASKANDIVRRISFPAGRLGCEYSEVSKSNTPALPGQAPSALVFPHQSSPPTIRQDIF